MYHVLVWTQIVGWTVMDMVLFNGQVLPHLCLVVMVPEVLQDVGHNVLLHLTLKYVPRLKALIAKEVNFLKVI